MNHELLIDADNHYYEPDDCFTRHLESRFVPDRAIHVRRDREDGLGRVFFGDQRLSWMKCSPADVSGAPGALQDYLRGRSARGSFVDAPVNSYRDHPEFMQRAPRLELMDRQGVQAAVFLPSLAVTVETDLRHDAEAMYANFRAFNRWLEDEWGYGADRTIGVPLMSLADCDLAVTELERVIDRGARMVDLRPGPVYGRSPADPHLDPFWARCAEAGIVVCFHSGNHGLFEFYSANWGEDPYSPGIFASPFQNVICTMERAAYDTMAALVLHRLFHRHPTLRVISIENGSEWVPTLMKDMDKAVGKGRDVWAEDDIPSQIFREHIWVVPYHEDSVHSLIEAIGVEHVVFGSDFPHPEGLKEPVDYFQDLAGLSAEHTRRIVHDNAAELLGISG